MRFPTAILLIGIAGCGGRLTAEEVTDSAASETASPEVGRTLEFACDEQASVLCRDFDKCSSFSERFKFVNAEDCIARGRKLCLERHQLPGVGDPVRSVDRCTSIIERTPCGEEARCFPDPSSGITGTLAESAACVAHEQCSTGYCAGANFPFAPECGHCRRIPVAGDRCSGLDDCGELLGLDMSCTDAGVCEPRLGRACSSSSPCNPRYACVGGTCRQGSLPEGSACSPTAGCAPSLVCDPSGKCSRGDVVLVGPGESCDDGEGRYCRGDYRCARAVCVPVGTVPCSPYSWTCGWSAACAAKSRTCEPLATFCVE